MSAWPVIAALAAITALVLFWPLIRSRRQPLSRRQQDLQVYRSQLAELEADLAAGSIAPDHGDSARREIQRRLLKAADQAEAVSDVQAGGGSRVMASFVVALIIAVSGGIYAYLGQPQLQGARPAIKAPQKQDQEMAGLATQLAEKLAAQPDNIDGWILLARTYATLARPAEAARALSRAIRLEPDDARLRANLGQMLVQSGNGSVSSAALVAFKKAHTLDPTLAMPDYYIALHDFQHSKPQSAYDRWLALYRRMPPEHPLRSPVRDALLRTAQQLGIDPAGETGLQDSMPALDKETAAAAKDMTAEDRQVFIRSMVTRLAAKMAQDPDNLEGWLRLGRAYSVLENWPRAADSYENANRLKPATVDILLLWARAVTNIAPNLPMPEEAIAIYAEIETLAPENSEALWFLGLAYAEQKNKDLALPRWRKLLDLLPAGSGQRQTLAAAIKKVEAGERPFE